MLRTHWRRDQHAAVTGLEERLERRLAALQTQIDDILDRRARSLDRDLFLIRTTLELNTANRRAGADDRLAFDPERVGAHIARAIARTDVALDPAPHVVIRDVLPQDTYDALLASMPPAMYFNQRDKVKLNLRLSETEILPDRTLGAMQFLEEEIISRAMVPALARVFDPYLRRVYERLYGLERGARLVDVSLEASEGRLMLRRPGYHLDPHLDPQRAAFTTLLYLARPGDNEAYGTTFFRLSGTLPPRTSKTYYPGHHGVECVSVKTVPFTPNTIVSFLNDGAAHGADIPKDAPKHTERYAYQFYVSPASHAAAAIVGEE